MGPAQFGTQCVLNWKREIKLPHVTEIADIEALSKLGGQPFRDVFQHLLAVSGPVVFSAGFKIRLGRSSNRQPPWRRLPPCRPTPGPRSHSPGWSGRCSPAALRWESFLLVHPSNCPFSPGKNFLSPQIRVLYWPPTGSGNSFIAPFLQTSGQSLHYVGRDHREISFCPSPLRSAPSPAHRQSPAPADSEIF